MEKISNSYLLRYINIFQNEKKPKKVDLQFNIFEDEPDIMPFSIKRYNYYDNCYVSSAATTSAFGRFWNIQNESCA